MAGVDKIIGTREQWIELHHWVATSKRPQYCRYFYPTPVGLSYPTGTIANTPIKVDIWLYENCPLPFVKKMLKSMYGGRKPHQPR